MKIKIEYVSKEKLHPARGAAFPEKKKIAIRNDLPKLAQRFLLAHEKYHIYDYLKAEKKAKQRDWLWGEIKANVYGFYQEPIGFLIILIGSFTPARINFYFNHKKFDQALDEMSKRLGWEK